MSKNIQFSLHLKFRCGENQACNVVYMWCFWYALRQTMCKFISRQRCWEFSS